MMTSETSVYDLAASLEEAWSLESPTSWTPANPAKGQCSVTAIVVHQLPGGEILKSRRGSGAHFCNRVDDQPLDFTISQFDDAITFEDFVSSRIEALTGASEAQIAALKRLRGV